MKRIKVGIVGVEAGRSWAARAHIPALRALADFEIVGVANRSLASAEKAAAALGVTRAFRDVAELISEVDVVTVTVRVPQHREIVRAALEAGRHVYCEWPLGNGLAEAEEMAAAARGVIGVVGTQAVVAPEVLRLKEQLPSIGEVLSTTITGYGAGWGGTIRDARVEAYVLDRANGATMLTIPVGHTLAAVVSVLGPIAKLASVLATRRPFATVAGTSDVLPVTAEDQVLFSGLLSSGAPIAVHYRGGMPRSGPGFLWEIQGTKGDLRITAPIGHLQLAPLELDGVATPGYDPVPGNVRAIYERLAQDVRHGTHTAPSFDDAVALHRLIARIESADIS